jgi:hypothetical protein
MNSEFVKNIPQFVMRIEMGRIPSRTRHFKKKDVVTNDALTIMPGQNPPNRGNKKWGYEIWFRPKELVDVTEELEYLGTNPVAQSLGYIEGPISDMAENNMIYEGIDKLVRPEYNTHQTFEQILTINLGTIITIKGISWASQYLDYVFVQDEYYMNTALTADVIYHEFAHIALSKYLEPKHSRPVIEGMADYFVAVQTGRTDLYEPQEDILRIRPKNALNEDLYAPYRETEPYARRDFVLSFLWKVRSNLIEVNNERAERGLKPVIDPDELVFETRKRLTESSVIYPDLTRALIDSYDKVCTVKRIKKDKDNKVIRRICDGGRLGLNAINKAIKQKGFF